VAERTTVALRLLGIAVDRGLASLDRFLDDLLSLGNLVSGVLRPVECVLHCVRRIDEALRRPGRGRGGAGDSVELEAAVLLSVSGGLDRRRHFTGHPSGVLLLGELDSTERGGGILELLLVVTEVAVELLLADASIGRGAGYLEVALSRRLEVGRHQAGERVVHALELFAHS